MFKASYSEKQFNVIPCTNIYLTQDGREVEVTEVNSNLNYKSNWNDAVDLGIVTKWLRQGTINEPVMAQMRGRMQR